MFPVVNFGLEICLFRNLKFVNLKQNKSIRMAWIWTALEVDNLFEGLSHVRSRREQSQSGTQKQQERKKTKTNESNA